MKVEREHRRIERPQIQERPPYLLILGRAFVWFFLRPEVRKFIKARNTYRADGLKLCWYRLLVRFGTPIQESLYRPFRNQLSHSQSRYVLAKCMHKPVLSIILVVHKGNGKWLEKCISSVISQYYTNWEVILVNDTTQKNSLKTLVNTWVSRDSRIRALCPNHNSTSAEATNSAIKQAKGEFIGFLDGDDELTVDALTWMVWAINKDPQARWLYSDEDKVSEDGRCHSPYFKPDFSPEMLLSNMYTRRFSVYSAGALFEVGGLRQLDGAQEYDLALRLAEVISREQIVHIPRVLYHCREFTGSPGTKRKAPMGAETAVAEALKRRNLKADVSLHKLCPQLFQIALQPSHFPKVSIIIPTRNALVVLRGCITAIREHTKYPNYEIIIVDNQSDDPQVKKYLATESAENYVRVMRYDSQFNHSKINNMAVGSVNSEFVVLMNNDVEIVSNGWLEQLVATAQMDESIGVVGALLLYPDGKVQHGGMIFGILGLAGHAHKRMDANSAGYFGRLYALQEMSGITAALSLVRRAAFELVGGFNAKRYPTSYNDVDLCIRLRKKGFRCIYNPMVRAIHYETKTRPITGDELRYQKRLMDDYSGILGNDPFYNPNLALDNERFSGFRRFPVKEQILDLADIPRGER